MIDIEFLNYKLKDMVPEILSLVLEWRNREEIRKVMYNSHIISIDQHIKWYYNIVETKCSIPKVMYCSDTPVGVVIFNDIINYKSCSWSFYIGNSMNKKGQGLILGYLALEYLFKSHSFEILTAEVIDFNKASINFHQKLGFSLDATIHNAGTKDNEKYKILKYSITKDKWKLRSVSIKNIILENYGMSGF